MTNDSVSHTDNSPGNDCLYTIVIPCYNETRRLDTERFISFLRRWSGVQLVFVNDGSTDATSPLLRTIEQASPGRVRIVDLAENQGKAEAVRRGIQAGLEGPARWLGYWDADLATPLEEVSSFIELCDAHQDTRFICGSRVLRLGARIKRHWYRHYPGRIIATCISILLGLPVYDTQCGAKLIERDLAAQIFAEPFCSRWLFDVELIARTICLLGKRETERIIYEYPLPCWKDVGESKVSLRYAPRIPLDLLRIHARYHRQFKP